MQQESCASPPREVQLLLSNPTSVSKLLQEDTDSALNMLAHQCLMDQPFPSHPAAEAPDTSPILKPNNAALHQTLCRTTCHRAHQRLNQAAVADGGSPGGQCNRVQQDRCQAWVMQGALVLAHSITTCSPRTGCRGCGCGGTCYGRMQVHTCHASTAGTPWTGINTQAGWPHR